MTMANLEIFQEALTIAHLDLLQLQPMQIVLTVHQVDMWKAIEDQEVN